MAKKQPPRRPRRASIQLQDPVRGRLERAAVEERRTMANLAEVLLEDALNRRDAQKQMVQAAPAAA